MRLDVIVRGLCGFQAGGITSNLVIRGPELCMAFAQNAVHNETQWNRLHSGILITADPNAVGARSPIPRLHTAEETVQV